MKVTSPRQVTAETDVLQGPCGYVRYYITLQPMADFQRISLGKIPIDVLSKGKKDLLPFLYAQWSQELGFLKTKSFIN